MDTLEKRKEARVVEDLMRRDIVQVSPSMPITELAGMLRRKRISGAPVVDPDGRVVGTVSVSDLAWLTDTFAAAGDDLTAAAKELERRTVGEVMTPDVFGVAPGDSLTELARFFARTGLRRAVVLQDGRLVGIVSVTDLLGLIADLVAP